MSGSSEVERYLAELKALLGNPLLPVQKTIASALGVDQPFVSRAATGKLTRVNDRVRLLYDYAKKYETKRKQAIAAAAAIDRESRRGRGSGKAKQSDRPVQAEDAIADLNTYLSDGYDPRLIVEQLAVLRRAQQVRRPGRPVTHGASSTPR